MKIIFSFFLLSLVCVSSIHAEDFFDGYVAKVLDGDTILLKGGTTVRYMGIDTPQTRVGNRAFQDIALKALELNKKMVEKKTVRLELVEPSLRDKNDARKFAYVFVSGQMVNALLLKKGLGVVSQSFPPDQKYAEYFAREQKSAISQSLGIWSMLQYKKEGNSHAF
jgi:micrococcal nuclease